jgi:hypothetical protein
MDTNIRATLSGIFHGTVDLPRDASDLAVLRLAKQAAGLSGVRGIDIDYGDRVEFHPYSMPGVLTITFEG